MNAGRFSLRRPKTDRKLCERVKFGHRSPRPPVGSNKNLTKLSLVGNPTDTKVCHDFLIDYPNSDIGRDPVPS